MVPKPIEIAAQAEAEAEELGSYRGFWEAFKQAEAAFIDENLQRIQVAAQEPKHWTAAMTLLERRRPQDFGRNQRIEIEANTTVTHVHQLDTDAAKALAQNILQALSESDTRGISEPSTPLLSEAAETD